MRRKRCVGKQKKDTSSLSIKWIMEVEIGGIQLGIKKALGQRIVLTRS
jgi:hypothetical protein